MKLVNSNSFSVFFDSEDEAFAYIHGVHLGAKQNHVADTHNNNSYLIPEIGEAFVSGILYGLKHTNVTTEFNVFNGFEAIVTGIPKKN